MATTSIWAVKGWLGQVVIYAENPEKTANPVYYEKQGMTVAQSQGLSDIIDYAVQSQKTQLMNENAEIMRHFVTGINCQADTARSEMMAVKSHFGKTDGVVAYHGYQSFAPGEVTPEIAHTIGVKLAEELWGDKFQVVVATHLDKANHIHSHFVLNNVSMVDGKKYYRSKRDYWLMQQTSDALCREYGLSVIEEPKHGKSKHYGEWKAEQDGRQTWRGMVKSDVDAAIRQSMTERQFWDNLKGQGYEVKIGKDISVRPPGKERFVRLVRNFGEDYAIESIRRRILINTRNERLIIHPNPPPKKVRFIGTIHRPRRMTGLRALYFYYLYRMGVLPKKREPNPKRVYFQFREDIRHMQNIARETRLLVKHGIDTAEQLTTHKDGLTTQINTFCDQRKHLRYQMRSIKDEDKLSAVKAEIATLSGKISELRREVRLCENIEVRSVDMRDKIRRAAESAFSPLAKTAQRNTLEALRVSKSAPPLFAGCIDEKSKGKERTSHEPFRGCR